MQKTRSFLTRVVTALFLLSGVAFAADEPLKIGIGISKPPYVIQENDSGVEYEIVERALEIAGYDMAPSYMPLLRIPPSLNNGLLDGGMHLRAHLQIDGFFSEEVIQYQNYAISVAGSDLDVRSIDDLKTHSVVAFQNAQRLLGERYARAVADNSQYSELANQALQVRMLKAGRIQLAVADFRIFLHFAKEIEKQDGQKTRFVFHRIFKPTPYRAAFRSRMVRDKFDFALDHMKRSGEYDDIIAKYMSKTDGLQIFR